MSSAASRLREIEEALAKLEKVMAGGRVVPDFFELVKHVWIEADPEFEGGVGGPIRFNLWDYQVERLQSWLDMNSEVILKPRQIGFSWSLALYVYFIAGFHESSHVALFSAGETEVKELMAKVAYIHEHLEPEWQAVVDGSFGIMSVSFVGGSSIRGYPATKKAGIGRTLRVAAFDEAAFHQYLKENQGAVVPALGSFGQLLILSTADPSLGESGHYHDFYFASKEGKTNCQAVFLPADIRPGRDAEWFERERRKYPGDPEKFAAFYPFTDSDAFRGRTGLVIPEFDRMRHVVKEVPPVEEWIGHVVGIDPGGGDPTGIAPVAIWRNQKAGAVNNGTNFVQWNEFARSGDVDMAAILEYLGKCSRKSPITKVLVGETGGNVITNTLLRAGYPAERLVGTRKQGLPLVRGLIVNDRLTIHESCVQSIREFSQYRWLESVDPNSRERYATSTPLDHHADLMDARRYALVWAVQAYQRTALTGKVRMEWVPG